MTPLRSKKKKVWVGWMWKGKPLTTLRKKDYTLSGVEVYSIEFYKKKPWEYQKIRITVEEIQ